jgi:DNA sulfur modification protein DndD
MGDNGSGKTTLAQVFTWCLYGDTTFEDKIYLCKSTSQTMAVKGIENVITELTLEHNNREYTIRSEQKYQKDSSGNIKSMGHRAFTISYKKDGNTIIEKAGDDELRMKEILPKELSRYFFFDGERIGNMSKEIRRGKSSEFAQAVRSLLGLSAFTEALDHLKSRGRNNVVSLYESSYDSSANTKIADYARQLKDISKRIEEKEDRIAAIDGEMDIAKEKCDSLNERIEKNRDSEALAKEKNRLIAKRKSLSDSKISRTAAILRRFNNTAPKFFAMKLMKDSLEALSQADKLDKGIPNITDQTIQHIINAKHCICGADVIVGNEAFNALTKLLDYIPPKSIGNMIGEFIKDCETRSQSADGFFEDLSDDYRFVREFDDNYAENETEISKIEKRLEGLESVGGLQADLSRYERTLNSLQYERDSLNRDIGGLSTKSKDLEAARQELANKDSNNRKIEVYKAYAQYMYDTLSEQYKEKETQMRQDLEESVNRIFRTIYNGGFSLSLDEKYNIQINVIGQEGLTDEIETSTAQSISVIFAFITGVIEMIRKSKQLENEMLLSETYPLVMDAPLSSFDKTRIRTVCEVLPTVAEQVIVFIKDADGEIAETHLGHKVGKRYSFYKPDKQNEFETYLSGGSENDF